MTETKTKMEPSLLKPPQAAAYLSISQRKLWQLTNCGEMPCVRIGRAVRYSRQTLDDWIEQREK